MARVDVELYEFLKEEASECGMYYDQEQKRMIAYAHIYFWSLDDFVKIVGPHHFDEGGLEVMLFESTICIDLQDIFESQGNCILDYKKCFNESDVSRWLKELVEEAS